MSAAMHLDARKINPADHIKLARRIAGRYGRLQQADFEDVRQEAFVGLIKASERFDPALGHRFSTLAWPYISGAISKHRNGSVGPFRVNPNAGGAEAKAYQDGTPLESIPEGRREAVEAVRRLRRTPPAEITEIEADIEADFDPALSVEDTGQAAVDNADEVAALIRKANLPPKQLACLLAYYGLDGRPPRTIVEIAREWGMAHSYPRTLIDKALVKLRRVAGAEGGGE